jgi:hypothetical protein
MESGQHSTRLSTSSLTSENELEDMICNDIGILNDSWLAIGRQVPTEHAGSIDILAINESGNLIVVELKKNRTPRDVVSQAIDYASWVKTIDLAKVASIYKDSKNKLKSKSESLDQALSQKFNRQFTEEEINGSYHQIVIVASALDPSTERIVKYLNDYEIPINTLFFNVFKDGENRYISRSWFIDPVETQEHANLPSDSSKRVSWNNEYYVSFGHEMGRHWEDARKYGFISAGGKPWYSQTLNQLSEGDRVWVNIPRTGYVGVGIVEEPAVIAQDFKVQTEKGMIPIIDAPLSLDEKDKKGYLIKYASNEEQAEYFVRVKWIRSYPIEQAVKQMGFFGNQNSVCKPKVPAWIFTVDTLKKKWGIE